MRSIPIKLPSQRFPTRGLNLARDGQLNLAEHDGINKLPIAALPIGLNILLGGEQLIAQNYYDSDESINAAANEDVIEDTEFQNYYIRGFHANGTGDAVVTLWATVLGRGSTPSDTAEMTVLAQGTIDIDNPHITIMLPNPVQVASGGQLKLNVKNTSGATAVYSTAIYGVSTTEAL